MEVDVMKRVPVREQDPKVRAKNFEEVCLGYNMEEAVELIGSFCVARHYTLEGYVIRGDVYGWVLDPKTQEDYFDILPV